MSSKKSTSLTTSTRSEKNDESGRTSYARTDELEKIIGGHNFPKFLLSILKHATPAGSEKVLTKYMPKSFSIDKSGNLIYLVGDWKKARTCFSSHLDTVQSRAEDVTIFLTSDFFIYGAVKSRDTRDKEGTLRRSVLGGDDKCGVYAMYRMMKAKVPGVYVFHVGEEIGCVGSKALVASNPDWLKHMDRVISLDRRGYSDIVNRQRGQECCSPEFVTALAEQLNKTIIGDTAANLTPFSPATGTYTDSAEYKNIVPECTNLSIGYFDAHSNTEHIDLLWLEKHMIPALIAVEWDKLPTKRDPKPAVVKIFKSKNDEGSNWPVGYSGYGGRISNISASPGYKAEWKNVTKWTTPVMMPKFNLSDGIPIGMIDRGGMLNALEIKLFVEGVHDFVLETYECMEAFDSAQESLIDSEVENSDLKEMLSILGLSDDEIEHMTPENLLVSMGAGEFTRMKRKKNAKKKN